MSITRGMKSNHGTSDDQCPRNAEKIPPQTPRLVRMGKKTIANRVKMASSWLTCKVF